MWKCFIIYWIFAEFQRCIEFDYFRNIMTMIMYDLHISKIFFKKNNLRNMLRNFVKLCFSGKTQNKSCVFLWNLNIIRNWHQNDFFNWLSSSRMNTFTIYKPKISVYGFQHHFSPRCDISASAIQIFSSLRYIVRYVNYHIRQMTLNIWFSNNTNKGRQHTERWRCIAHNHALFNNKNIIHHSKNAHKSIDLSQNLENALRGSGPFCVIMLSIAHDLRIVVTIFFSDSDLRGWIMRFSAHSPPDERWLACWTALKLCRWNMRR